MPTFYSKPDCRNHMRIQRQFHLGEKKSNMQYCLKPLEVVVPLLKTSAVEHVTNKTTPVFTAVTTVWTVGLANRDMKASVVSPSNSQREKQTNRNHPLIPRTVSFLDLIMANGAWTLTDVLSGRLQKLFTKIKWSWAAVKHVPCRQNGTWDFLFF